MSLINKMLQDLDARGGDGTRADASSLVRPVNHGSRGGVSPAAIGAGVVALAVLAAGGYFAWKHFGGVKQPVSPPVASRAAPAAPVVGAVPQSGPAVATDVAAGARTAHAAPVVEERGRHAGRRAGGGAAEAEATSAPVAAAKPAGAARLAGAGGERRVAGPKPAERKQQALRTRPEEMGRIIGEAKPAAAAEGGDAGLNSQQKAENEYRRALVKLQDARVSEAIAGLEQAVFLYPRHEAARQTLVSLLVESGRSADAMRHLVFATSLDPRQANMAMLLARLQLEHGGNALDTLQRSLPYAESNADYRALMAGMLQRAHRHQEAVEHYQAAVRLQPANGVWWMGMGISLQADKRNAEAKIAFQHAKDSGRLSPELQSFVERRLQQLN